MYMAGFEFTLKVWAACLIPFFIAAGIRIAMEE